MELGKKCGLELTVAAVVGIEGLEDLVKSLEEKTPKVVERTKHKGKVGYMSSVVMVGANSRSAIELYRC